MANYNTFILIDTKAHRIGLVTSSARQISKQLCKGLKVEVWNENRHIETIYFKDSDKLTKYRQAEKEYIRQRQERSMMRNAKRRQSKQQGKSETAIR